MKNKKNKRKIRKNRIINQIQAKTRLDSKFLIQ